MYLLFLGLLVIFLAVKGIKIVSQSEEYLVERLGKYNRKLSAGINYTIPFYEKVSHKINLKTQVLDSIPQPVITRDNVGMTIDTVTFYKITDSVKSAYEIQDYERAILNITATTLRDVIGSLELDETLSSRDAINTRLRTELDKATDAWGIRVERVEVKDIMPPKDISDAMESQMRAERAKRASVLEAQGRKEAAILDAEGAKEAIILNAQADNESQILNADAERQSQILKAQGEAEAIERIAIAEQLRFKALKDSNIDDAILNLEAIQALREVAKSDNKMVVPYESQAIMGAVQSFKGLTK